MVKITLDLIRKLREESGAPVMRVKKVLEDLAGDEKKALDLLKKEGFEKAAKRGERETKAGAVFAYVHHNQKVAGVTEIFSETDFVAKNELFQILGKNLAMQVASMGENNFNKQEFIKDPSKKIEDLVKEVIAKTGENIRIGRIFKIELGKNK
jgi:elongation factor Ts